MDEWLLLQEGILIYIAVFVLLMGGAIGLPIPEDLPVLMAGVLAQSGRGDTLWLMLTCYIAILCGDALIFFVGRYFGSTLFKKPWFKARVSQSRMREIRRKLEKRRFITILLARHLFYLRTITFLICGAVKMRFPRFIIADALAALISVPIVFGIGYLASEHIDAAMAGLHKGSVYLGIGVAVVIVGLLIRRHLRGLKSLSDDSNNKESCESRINNGCSTFQEPSDDCCTKDGRDTHIPPPGN